MKIIIIVAMLLVFLIVILLYANIKKAIIKIPFISIDIDTKDNEHEIIKK